MLWNILWILIITLAIESSVMVKMTINYDMVLKYITDCSKFSGILRDVFYASYKSW